MTRRISFLFLLLLLSGGLILSAQSIGSVTKVAQGNPSIGIVKYSGIPESRKILETMLSRCDWFTVLRDKGGSAQVQLSVAAGNFGYQVDVSVAGAAVSNFHVDGHGTDWNDAAAKVTDAILKQIFGVPALCTRKIAFSVTDKNGCKEIYSLRIDGSDKKRLTYNNAISTEASWGHAGAFVYTLNKNNSLGVVLVDVKNNRQRTISRAPGLNSSAALSMSGQFVALPMSLGKQVDLYLLNLAKNSRTRLTQDRDVESSPVFSPDGTQLCYVSDKTGRPQLYIMSVTGGDARRLTRGAGEAVSPDWSPRSKKICYSTRIGGQYVIAVIDPAGGEEPEIITEAAGNWEAPSWAPDGRHIVCTRSTGGKQDLYLVDTMFHTFQALTQGAKISLPAWQPAR